ncbi:hypothetical protein ZWY2020_007574 [Hordeum vulgare]|nr:hypothetical protein ZWY2020_007574 [Hordeum vulgare]
MVGRPRPHLGGRPRAHRGRQHGQVRLSTVVSLLPPSRQLLDAEAGGNGDVSSSGSRPRSGSPALLPVKLEPQETPLGRRTRNTVIVINEPDASSRLVKPKTEPGLLPVKKEHLAMAAADEAALKWARDDYVWDEMEQRRRTLEEIAACHRSCEEGGVIILDEGDEEVPVPSNPIRHDGPRKGCSKDGGGAGGNDDDDGDGDYTNFYKLLGM